MEMNQINAEELKTINRSLVALESIAPPQKRNQIQQVRYIVSSSIMHYERKHYEQYLSVRCICSHSMSSLELYVEAV